MGLSLGAVKSQVTTEIALPIFTTAFQVCSLWTVRYKFCIDFFVELHGSFDEFVIQ